MATNPAGDLFGYALSRVVGGPPPEVTDGDLLARFVEHRDEAAFAALVRRYGAMVWGVCRRALDHHDAEDAFQATFLVLARKAGSVSPPTAAAWLYGVAYRAACKARTTRHRRREVTGHAVEATATEVAADDLRPLLDHELARLPDRHRAAVVLCDLEGLTRRQASARLGVPEGTVAGWQARGRARLAARLTRRGVVPAVALATAAAARAEASARVSLLTLRSAIPFATGGAVAVSPPVAALVNGVSRVMLFAQLKPAFAAVACAAGLTTWFVAPRDETARAALPVPRKADPPGKADVPKGEKEGPGEWADLKGDWEVNSAVVDGRKAVPAGKKPDKAEVELPFNSCMVLPPVPGGQREDSVGWLVLTTNGRLFQEWPVLKFDPAAKPMTLTVQTHGRNVLAPNQGVDKGLYYHAGIYRVAGDTLTICLSQGDWRGTPVRPERFEAGEKTGNTLITLKRVTKGR